jgi:hypothetical protein
MRRFLVLCGLFIGVATLAFAPSDASAKPITVKLTQQQVATVCGKELSSAGNRSGCHKNCGAGNKQICGFECDNKTKQCGGQCVTCAARKFPFGTAYPGHVVNKSVRQAE